MPNALANRIARNLKLIAKATHAGLNGNGPMNTGDGWRYCGPISGRANYRAACTGIAQPQKDEPERPDQPEFAALQEG